MNVGFAIINNLSCELRISSYESYEYIFFSCFMSSTNELGGER